MKTEIGPKRTKGPWDIHFDKWVTVYTHQDKTFSGKLVEILDGYGRLSPFLDGRYNEKGEYIYNLYNGSVTAYLIGSTIGDTTKRNIENFCRIAKKNHSKRLTNNKGTIKKPDN